MTPEERISAYISELEALRIARQLTRADLARRIGMGEANVNHFFHRRYNPKFSTVAIVSSALGLAPWPTPLDSLDAGQPELALPSQHCAAISQYTKTPRI